MKNYYQQNKKRDLGWLPISSGLLIVGVIINIVSGGMFQGMVSTPALAALGIIKSHPGVIAAPIANQNDEQVASLNALRTENDQLRSFVHLASSTVGIMAPVISTPSSSPYGTFRIGRGSQDGIHINDIALSDSGFAIGVVTEVSNHSAVIEEVTSPRNQIDIVLSSTGATLVGSGGGNGTFQLPRTNKIQIGDIIYAPTLGNYPIAQVGHIESTPSSASYDVYASLPINLNILRFVYVVE